MLPNKIRIEHKFTVGERTFTVTDGSNLIWTAVSRATDSNIYVFSGNSTDKPIYTIQRSTSGASYDFKVLNQDNQIVGVISYNALSSYATKFSWKICDSQGNEIATGQAAGGLPAILLSSLLSKRHSYNLLADNNNVCTYQELSNGFSNFSAIEINFSEDMPKALSKQICVIAGILLLVRDKRRSSAAP